MRMCFVFHSTATTLSEPVQSAIIPTVLDLMDDMALKKIMHALSPTKFLLLPSRLARPKESNHFGRSSTKEPQTQRAEEIRDP
jgi:hypothetical protein